MPNVDPNYDYSKDDQADDGFTVPDVAAHEKSAEQIKADNTFRDPAEGYHVMVLDDYDPPKTTKFEVLLNGQTATFTSKVVGLKFVDPEDKMISIRDFITLPPRDESQLPAYRYGVICDEKTHQPTWGGRGREANKFYTVVSALGFAYEPGKKLPTEALSGDNWKGRKVGFVVNAAKPYKDDKGVDKPGRARIKLFSYQLATAPPPDVDARGVPAQEGSPLSRNSKPVEVPAGMGTDDI
jgi:hypothetical protein